MRSMLFNSSLVNRLNTCARCYTTALDVGGAGSIRAAGGIFGRLEAAREQDYFLKKQHEQLMKLKDNQISMELFHQKQIKDLEEELNRNKAALRKLRAP